MPRCKIDLQIIDKTCDIPKKTYFKQWIEMTLNFLNYPQDVEICIRIVDESEMSALNQTYRQKNGPTNILSFPYEIPAHITERYRLLGDLICCASVITREAKEQHKTLIAHWAHLIIHGVLHLLGYDHIKEQDAAKMESLEIKLMEKLDLPNPYQEENTYE